VKHSRPSDGRGLNRVARRIVGVCVSCVSAAAVAILPACSSVLEAQPPPANLDSSLLKGSGIPICESYTDWIERRQPTDSASPFRVDLGQRYVGLESEWFLLTKVEDYVWERDVNPANNVQVDQVPQWQGTLEQRARARELFHKRFEMDLAGHGYQIGLVDVDNNAVAENVFFSSRQSGSTLVVLNEDKTDVDVEKTEKILAHPSRREAGWRETKPTPPDDTRFSIWPVVPVYDAYFGAEYAVLSFEGTTFVWFRWRVHPDYTIREWSERDTQHIYRTDGDRSEEVCEIRIIP